MIKHIEFFSIFSMATSPRFLKAVRDRLAAREKSSNPSKRKLSLDDLLTWTDMPTENGDVSLFLYFLYSTL